MNTADDRGARSALRYAVFGFLMGTANVIPGVSGGTVAFVLGFYQKLIEALKTLAEKKTWMLFCSGRFREFFALVPWRFLAALGGGMALAVLTLAKVMEKLLTAYESYTFSFFIGLILASVLLCIRMVSRWHADAVAGLLLGTGVGYLVIRLVPTSTPDSWWCLMLCGAIAISAMILPGISGSFVLLLLGQYYTVLRAITWEGFDLRVIFWFGLGCLAGLGSIAHLLSWLFRRFRDMTTAVMIGFMLGSLIRLWPWQQVVDSVTVGDELRVLASRMVFPDRYGVEFWSCLLLMAAGAGITAGIELLARRHENTVK